MLQQLLVYLIKLDSTHCERTYGHMSGLNSGLNSDQIQTKFRPNSEQIQTKFRPNSDHFLQKPYKNRVWGEILV